MIQGPIALLFEEPPLRPGRGDEGRGYFSFKTKGVLNPAAMDDGAAANTLVTAGLTVQKWHGDTVNFEAEGAKFNDPPAVHAGAGGLAVAAGLTPPYGPVVRINKISAVGFEVEANLEEMVGQTVPRSAPFVSQAPFHPQYQASKVQAAPAWDDTYTYHYNLTVAPSSVVVVEAWMHFSGSWHLVGTRRFFNDDPTFPSIIPPQEMPITRSGMNTTGFVFGMDIRTESGGGGSVAPDRVTWEEGLAPNKVPMSKGASPPIQFMIVGR